MHIFTEIKLHCEIKMNIDWIPSQNTYCADLMLNFQFKYHLATNSSSKLHYDVIQKRIIDGYDVPISERVHKQKCSTNLVSHNFRHKIFTKLWLQNSFWSRKQHLIHLATAGRENYYRYQKVKNSQATQTIYDDTKKRKYKLATINTHNFRKATF